MPELQTQTMQCDSKLSHIGRLSRRLRSLAYGDDSDRSRMLGISLDFALSVFPGEARGKMLRLVRHVQAQPSISTHDEAFLNKITEAGEGDGDIHNLTFLELAEIVAHGDLAYG